MSNCTENGDLTHKGMTAQWQYNSEGTVPGKNGKRRPVPYCSPGYSRPLNAVPKHWENLSQAIGNYGCAAALFQRFVVGGVLVGLLDKLTATDRHDGRVLLMLFAQKVVDCLYRIKGVERNFHEDGVPVAHRSVP